MQQGPNIIYFLTSNDYLLRGYIKNRYFNTRIFTIGTYKAAAKATAVAVPFIVTSQ